MTQALRKDFNAMSIALNKAIEEAVSRNTDNGVKWIPIDGEMQGHRFCEPGVNEPNQKNPNLWLWHYPYNEPDDKVIADSLEEAYQKATVGKDVKIDFDTYASLQSAVFDNVQNDPHDAGWFDWVWRGVGNRVKVFHPQLPLHEKIRNLILDTYISDMKTTTPPVSPPVSVPEKNECRGIGGDTWVMYVNPKNSKNMKPDLWWTQEAALSIIHFGYLTVHSAFYRMPIALLSSARHFEGPENQTLLTLRY
jgi:hypothetical protein